jgi:hypothetical protein
MAAEQNDPKKNKWPHIKEGEDLSNHRAFVIDAIRCFPQVR